MVIPILEDFAATWEKRFMQSHYSYQDSQSGTALFLGAGVLGEATGLALLETQAALAIPGTVYYPFGYNARNNAFTGAIGRWPNLGDFGVTADVAPQNLVPRGQCYARSVMIYVTEDTWIRFISLNPLYTVLVAQQYSATLIASWGISSTITGVEQFIPAGANYTFDPTYGLAMAYRADTVQGTIEISVEGNVEGGE